MPTGAQQLAAALAAAEVDVVFGLPGVHNLALWEALRPGPVRLVGVRHEQAAAYAADGYARATGRPGVALVTTGPGAANTLGALGEAFTSGSPVVVVATDVPHALKRPGVRGGALHELADQAALFAPVTKAQVRAEPGEDLGALVADALAEALAAPSAPVLLEIPTDLLDAPGGAGTRARAEARAAATDGRSLAIAAALLRGAERPLLWCGGGARDAGGAVAQLAATLGAPVLTTTTARGLLAGDALLVGLPAHVPEAGALWDDADVVVAVGSDLDGMSTQNWRQPQPPRLIVINVDAADAAKNYVPDVVVELDASAGSLALVRALNRTAGPAAVSGGSMGNGPTQPPLTAPWVDLGALREGAVARLRGEHPDDRFLDAFAGAVPAGATVVADMCIPGYWLSALYAPAGPRRLLYPMGWGTLGFALPAALGASLAGRTPTVCVCGDGGFLFACGELATVAQEELPLTTLIVDDGGYGMLRYDQRVKGLESFGVDLRTPDLVALARSFGLRADRVDGLGEAFGAALAEHVAAPEPTVLVASARLEPPPTTSPRWYRTGPPHFALT